MSKIERPLFNPIRSSLILEKLGQISFVENLLPGWSFTLLYRGSRDGWKNKDFHDRCDNKGATVTVIKSSKGRISGGYTQ